MGTGLSVGDKVRVSRLGGITTTVIDKVRRRTRQGGSRIMYELRARRGSLFPRSALKKVR